MTNWTDSLECPVTKRSQIKFQLRLFSDSNDGAVLSKLLHHLHYRENDWLQLGPLTVISCYITEEQTGGVSDPSCSTLHTPRVIHTVMAHHVWVEKYIYLNFCPLSFSIFPFLSLHLSLNLQCCCFLNLIYMFNVCNSFSPSSQYLLITPHLPLLFTILFFFHIFYSLVHHRAKNQQGHFLGDNLLKKTKNSTFPLFLSPFQHLTLFLRQQPNAAA